MNPIPEGPRHAVITPDNHGALIQITSWVVMIALVLTTGLRLAVTFKNTPNPGIGDALCVVAMVSEHAVMYNLESNTRLICTCTVDCSGRYHCHFLRRQLWPGQEVRHSQFVASLPLRDSMQTPRVVLWIMELISRG